MANERFKEFSGRLIAAILDEMKRADKTVGNGLMENERVTGFVEGLYRAESIALAILVEMERKEQEDNG